MSDPGVELLRGVLEAPDDDPPRLVYADWLMERGDPRGEFISVQVQLRQRINPARRARAKKRERELLDRHREPFSAPAKPTGARLVFRRGFIDELQWVETAALIEHGPGLLAVEPVRRVQLRGVTAAQMEQLLAAGLIGRLSHLSLGYGTFEPEALTALAGSGQLASLRYLSLGGTNLDDEGLAQLVASPHLRCTRLALHSNQLSDAGAAALAAWPRLGACTHLCLARNQIGDDGAAALAAAPLDALLLLQLGGNPLGDDGAMAFAEPARAGLRLDLEGISLSEETAESLREAFGARVKIAAPADY